MTEVFPYGGCTAIPGCAPALLGVINVRGDIRPVADLRELLELPPAEDRPAGYVVMVRHRDRVIGVRIETVEGVRQNRSGTADVARRRCGSDRRRAIRQGADRRHDDSGRYRRGVIEPRFRGGMNLLRRM